MMLACSMSEVSEALVVHAEKLCGLINPLDTSFAAKKM